MAKKRVTAEQRVLWAALAWQEYNDRANCRWVRGSNIGKLLTAVRRLRKLRRVDRTTKQPKENPDG